MVKEYRNLRQEYENIKKLVNKIIHTKEDQREIGIFKSNVNSYGKKAKVPKYAIDDFNKAIDNMQANREEFIISTDIIFDHLDGVYRR